MLTGALTQLDQLSPADWRLTTPRFQADTFASNLSLVEKVKAMAARKGCAPGNVALAWVHAQGDDVFSIPGTKRVRYLEENAGAVGVTVRPGPGRRRAALFACFRPAPECRQFARACSLLCVPPLTHTSNPPKPHNETHPRSCRRRR